MKRIAIISVGMNPVPAVKGGAVENLIQFLLDENENLHKFNISLYSVFDEEALSFSKKYKNTNFFFIKTNSITFKIKRLFRGIYNKYIDYTGNEYLRNVLSLMQNEQFDIILVENFPMAPLILKKKFNVPIILHIHNDWINIHNKYSNDICSACNLILTVSDFIKGRIKESVGQSSNIQTLYNGVDISRFSAPISEEKYSSLCKSYNINKNDIIFIFSGRIHPDKGIKEMLLAFSGLKIENIKLFLVGASSYKDSEETPYFKEVMKLASKYSDKIIFSNYVPYEEIHNYFHLGDIYLSTSMCNEALPLSVIEAMASSLPIIAFRSGGVPELLTEENSFLIDKDENMISNLQEKMSLLANDRNLRLKMGKKSLEQAQKFSSEKYVKNICEILNRV